MLDVNTPRGQTTIQEERDAVSLFTASFPNIMYVDTPKKGSATVDAVLFRQEDGILCGVVETKCRQMTHSQLLTYNNEWLVTWDKIDASRRIAESLGVPLYGFLYLVPDRTLLVRVIADENGALTQSIRIEATQTQRTVNGGQVVRNNAYINMTNCREIR